MMEWTTASTARQNKGPHELAAEISYNFVVNEWDINMAVDGRQLSVQTQSTLVRSVNATFETPAGGGVGRIRALIQTESYVGVLNQLDEMTDDLRLEGGTGGMQPSRLVMRGKLQPSAAPGRNTSSAREVATQDTDTESMSSKATVKYIAFRRGKRKRLRQSCQPDHRR